MAVALTAAVAGTAAAAAWANAKFHIQHDIAHGVLRNPTAEAQQFLIARMKENRMMLYHEFEYWAQQDRPNHVFLEYQGRSWTYKQFFQNVQRVGNWLMKDLGVQRHELVAMTGPNSPEYLFLWMALDGIGACQAFVNHHLTGAALTHSVKLCEPRYLIAERETHENVEACRGDLEQAGVKIIYFDEAFFSAFSDTTPLPPSRTAGFTPADLRCLIYTSGTTGLPKGVCLSTGRTINMARIMKAYLNLGPGKKLYTCLPMYHGAAQGLAVAPVVGAGATLHLSRKFSHKTFWDEVAGGGADVIQYVGELCRYLVNAPPHPLERKHHVSMAWGNGMRPDVWEKFRQRFNIPCINELYAATDGMGFSYNPNQGGFGRNAVGLRGALWHWRRGQNELRVQIDPDTEEIKRTPEGFAIRCVANEPGEVIHRGDPATASAAFRGYYNNEGATSKRWLRGVFAPDDLWFRSGDMMRQDADGRVFFVDRLGDTFRWKSENVSTHEVADVLGLFPPIAEANVYGVAVPHADGRCGCAMLVLRNSSTTTTLDGAGLARFVLARLPRYAVPLFLRVVPELEHTGTFKIQKGQAKREGIDVDVIARSASADRLFWLPPGTTAYRPFTKEDWEALKRGAVSM